MLQLVALAGLSSMATEATPTSVSVHTLDNRNANLYINTGEPTSDRTIFTMISLFCMMVLCLLLGMCFIRSLHAVPHTQLAGLKTFCAYDFATT